MSRLALVGDIGGTNSRFGLVEQGSLLVQNIQALKNDNFSSLEDAISAYISQQQVGSLFGAAIAVAAPVDRDRITLTNRDWTFTASSLQAAAHSDDFRLLNDYEALALALPYFKDGDLMQVGGAAPQPRAVKLVLGPGTGLGMAALVPIGPQQRGPQDKRGDRPMTADDWLTLPCEPGHTNLPVETQAEFDWREAMRKPGQVFSAEDAITGGGLYLMYKVLAPHGLLTTPEAVIEAALIGDDINAVRTVDQFIVWLARIAGDAAIEHLAKGGVYLAGGIVPSIISLLKAGTFRQVFENKGKLTDIMEPIPVYVIIDQYPAFKGCAAVLLT